jgi:hypothetical protein
MATAYGGLSTGSGRGGGGTPDDNSVSTVKLQDTAVTTGKLATSAVVTAKLSNDAVTNAKLANEAEATIKGRAAGAGTGDPTDLTPEQARTVAFGTEVNDGSSSTADTIDWSQGQHHRSTLTGDCTYTFTPPSYHGLFLLKLIQDGTGSRHVTWPASVLWPGGTAPTLSTTAGAVDIVTFYYDGTNYFGIAHAGAGGGFA